MFKKTILLLSIASIILLTSCINHLEKNSALKSTSKNISLTKVQMPNSNMKLSLKTIDTNPQNAFKQNANYIFIVDGGIENISESAIWWQGESLYMINKQTNIAKEIYTGNMIHIELVNDEYIVFKDSSYYKNADVNPFNEYVYNIKFNTIRRAKKYETSKTFKQNVYYSEATVGFLQSLYTKPIEGGKVKLISENVKWFNIIGEYLVYETSTDVNLLNLDTNVKRKVISFKEDVTDSVFSVLGDGYITYFNNGYSHKNGTAYNIETLEKLNNVPDGLNDQNAFYYSDVNNLSNVYRYDGMNRKLLIKDYDDNLSIIGEYIYFTKNIEGKRECYRLKKDGTNLEKVVK